MSQREYLKALNKEIQKINEIIDRKIIQNVDYKWEARRHMALLAKIRKGESRSRFPGIFRAFFPLWR